MSARKSVCQAWAECQACSCELGKVKRFVAPQVGAVLTVCWLDPQLHHSDLSIALMVCATHTELHVVMFTLLLQFAPEYAEPQQFSLKSFQIRCVPSLSICLVFGMLGIPSAHAGQTVIFCRILTALPPAVGGSHAVRFCNHNALNLC